MVYDNLSFKMNLLLTKFKTEFETEKWLSIILLKGKTNQKIIVYNTVERQNKPKNDCL